MYAIIKLEVPDTRAETLRTAAEYHQGESVTIRQYLNVHLKHLAAAFGPECTATVQASGPGAYPKNQQEAV